MIQAIQLAQTGTENVVPTVMGAPLRARANCKMATMAKITAARSEKFLAVIGVPPFTGVFIPIERWRSSDLKISNGIALTWYS
jgi:hypothetical protein